MGRTNNVMRCAAQILTNAAIDSAIASSGYLTVYPNPNGSDNVGDALEMPNNRLLFGEGDFDHNMNRYTTQSSVPQITGKGALMQTTRTGTYQWFINGTDITGATSNTYAPPQNGFYAVLFNDVLSCGYWSDSLFLTDKSVSELYAGLKGICHLNNPFSHFLEFLADAPLAGKISCKLYDITGKMFFNAAIGFNATGMSTIEIP